MNIVMCHDCKKYHAFGTVFCPKHADDGVAFSDYDKADEYYNESKPAPKPKTAPVKPAERKKRPPLPKEKETEYARNWREKNRDKYNQTQREWRERNKEHRRNYMAQYMRDRRKG